MVLIRGAGLPIGAEAPAAGQALPVPGVIFVKVKETLTQDSGGVDHQREHGETP